MAFQNKSYVEHMAIRVKDIQWYIRFFEDAFGISVCTIDGATENPNQVWLSGGIQLISDPSFEGAKGRMDHIAIVTEDLELALQQIHTWEVTEASKGRNWIELPDGLLLELIQSKGNAVEKWLNVEVSYM
ncbi:VOC family protein [Sporosarcina sp. FSL K6-2383]|uniref:VOC family protein n=1 Tax=Sporosarcina sp. FSL K6-2383 TaxID=2921556 RepID=UPI00315A3976